MKYRLDAEEEYMVRDLANMRCMLADKLKRSAQKIGPQSDFEIDMVGMGGEWAVAHLFDVMPPWRFDVDKGYDLEIRGRKVDVKTTKYPDGRLLAKLNTNASQVDTFFLVIADWPEFNLVGWATAFELLQTKNITAINKNQTYALT
jgi:hypothetical protein